MGINSVWGDREVTDEEVNQPNNPLTGSTLRFVPDSGVGESLRGFGSASLLEVLNTQRIAHLELPAACATQVAIEFLRSEQNPQQETRLLLSRCSQWHFLRTPSAKTAFQKHSHKAGKQQTARRLDQKLRRLEGSPNHNVAPTRAPSWLFGLDSGSPLLSSREKLYTPPPLPHFWPKGIFHWRGVGVYILRPHAAGILYAPPLLYTPHP